MCLCVNSAFGERWCYALSGSPARPVQGADVLAQAAGAALWTLTKTFFSRLLNNNQIKSIPGGSFEDLENLKYL